MWILSGDLPQLEQFPKSLLRLMTSVGLPLLLTMSCIGNPGVVRAVVSSSHVLDGARGIEMITRQTTTLWKVEVRY